MVCLASVVLNCQWLPKVDEDELYMQRKTGTTLFAIRYMLLCGALFEFCPPSICKPVHLDVQKL